jgi:hypothetical protein
MREEGEVLEHQPDAAFLRWNEVLRTRHLLAIEQRAARCWPLNARVNP